MFVGGVGAVDEDVVVVGVVSVVVVAVAIVVDVAIVVVAVEYYSSLDSPNIWLPLIM